MAAEKMIIVRFSEIALKSPKVRKWMLEVLKRNITSALRNHGVAGEVEGKWERLYITTGDQARAVEAASRVFGVKSLSPAWVIEYETLENLLEKAVECVGELVKGRSFAVRARRDKTLPFTSMDIMRNLGERLRDMGGRVDLERPEVTVSVEVRGRIAYLFTEVVGGPGGLPLGTQGKALSLISGGFDSAVSSWYTMRRGVEVDYITFSLAGPLQMRDALLVADILVRTWSHGYHPTLYMVNFSEVLSEIERGVKRSMRGVVLRHLFYRGAEIMAKKNDHLAIVTGESIGQVSSQTLQNLHTASNGITIPILRPLLGMDKEEIIAEARRIGTAEISSHVAEYCAITGGGNVSVGKEDLDKALEKVDMEVLVKAVEEAERVRLPEDTRKALKNLERMVERWRWGEGEGEKVVYITYRNGLTVSLPDDFPLTAEELKSVLKNGVRSLKKEIPHGFRYVFSCPTGGWAIRMVEILRASGHDAYYTA